MAPKTPQLLVPFLIIVLVSLTILCGIFLSFPLFKTSAINNGRFSCFGFSGKDNQNIEPYRLFGTKTTYLTAREEIRKIFKSQWPFDPKQCSPEYFFFLNRHSIRYPSVKEIRKFKDLLPALRDQFISGGKLNTTVFKDLFNWKLLMSEVDENRVSQSGKLETAITGK